MGIRNRIRTEENIRKRLSRIHKRRIEDGISGEAGVLVSIIFRNDQPHFVLTRRTETVATHKGQISFPGGMKEKGDRDLLATALRETKEEIGVNVDSIDVLGEFHDYIAITDHLVRPFAGIIPEGTNFQVSEEEVAYLLEVPISFFLESPPRIEQHEHHGTVHNVYFYDFNGNTIWGLTARIIKDFVEETCQP